MRHLANPAALTLVLRQSVRRELDVPESVGHFQSWSSDVTSVNGVADPVYTAHPPARITSDSRARLGVRQTRRSKVSGTSGLVARSAASGDADDVDALLELEVCDGARRPS